VPIPDDERFERYLKQFRPAAAEPLLGQQGRTVPRRWVFAFAAAAALAVLAASVVAIRLHRRPASSAGAESAAGVQQLTSVPPLTLGRANDLLIHAPSFKSAIDQLPFQPERRQVPEGAQSALAVLSQEEKL